ncbi:MAG: hypothetical protein RR909_00640 [Bacilli bacterium]
MKDKLNRNGKKTLLFRLTNRLIAICIFGSAASLFIIPFGIENSAIKEEAKVVEKKVNIDVTSQMHIFIQKTLNY